MIKVTDLGDRVKYINADLIERIEANHDTMVFLVNGHSLVVKETPEELLEKVVSFKSRCLESAVNRRPPEVLADPASGDSGHGQLQS